MHIRELIQLLDSILDPSSYRDYAPNGLQVQGSRDIKRLVTGVTASLDLIEAAAAQGADAILVHHGWFWKGEEARITGIRYQRISRLIKSGMHLIGYHLPLDDHPEIGNNALLGKALGLSGGQQQRLCIARALAVEPEVLLMDEPCSALDPIATQRVEESILELKQSLCIVIVTHNMQQAARVSDKTAFFFMGKLIEFDDTDTIFNNAANVRTRDYVNGRFG